MIQYKKLMMTLALLLTAVTGAWADEPKVYTTAVDVTSLKVGDILAEGFSLTSTNPNGAIFNIADQRGKRDETIHPGGYMISTKNITAYGANATFTTADGTYYPIDENSNVGNAWVVTQECNQLIDMDLIIAGVTIELPLKVTWNATAKTGTFAMPASDVVLTPIYAAATVYGSDGQTEKSAYASLKEAFLAAQNGDIIKLDGDVTVTSATDLSTSNRASADPVQFTIDFNGHVLDGYTLMTPFIVTNHEGDEIRFIDSSEGETGGLKGLVGGTKNSIVFASGRFNFGEGSTADYIENQWNTLVTEYGWTMAEGKKFVDLEGAPVNGFLVGIGLADYDISFSAANANTIEAGKATVTIDGAAATLTEGKVTGVNMGQQVKMTAAQGYKFRKVEVKKGEAPATPEGPTLAQTLTTANMTVKVYYIYTDMNNTCEFLSNGDGTYTFQSGTGLVGGNSQKAKALVVENGKLVFKQNFYETLSKLWNQVGFSVTFDTSENTYSIWKGSNETINATLSKVEVNGTQIALTQQ